MAVNYKKGKKKKKLAISSSALNNNYNYVFSHDIIPHSDLAMLVATLVCYELD